MMVSNTTDSSTGDTAYTMPDFGNLPGFAEAARAFAKAGAETEIPPAVLELVASNDLITEDDIADMKQELLSRSGGSTSDPDVAAAVKMLESSIGTSRNNLGRLQSAVESATNNAQNRSAEKNETKEQKVERLLAEMKAIDEEIDGDLEKLLKRGHITQERYDELKAQRAKLDAMDPLDPKRVQGERAYTTAVDTTFKEARTKAEHAGDDEGVALTTHGQEKVGERREKLAEYEASYADAIREKQVRQAAEPEAETKPITTVFSAPSANANKVEQNAPTSAAETAPVQLAVAHVDTHEGPSSSIPAKPADLSGKGASTGF